MIDTEPKTYISQPNGLVREEEIRQAAAVIDAQAQAGLMWPHGERELRRMARQGNLTLLKTIKDGKEEVGGVGGLTKIHRARRFLGVQFGRVIAAEFGALALAPELQGNGYGGDIVEASAQNFIQRFHPGQDVILFAMAKVTNPGSNKLFTRLTGEPIDQELLPKAARGEEFNAYNITPVGRRLAGQ